MEDQTSSSIHRRPTGGGQGSRSILELRHHRNAFHAKPRLLIADVCGERKGQGTPYSELSKNKSIYTMSTFQDGTTLKLMTVPIFSRLATKQKPLLLSEERQGLEKTTSS
jgi:hypothetical protein